MTQTNTTRKKRTDRNHIIYELRINGLNYIGVTAKTETTINKSVLARAAKHYYRAKTESKNWLLCEALRELTDKSEIEVLVHEVIRHPCDAHVGDGHKAQDGGDHQQEKTNHKKTMVAPFP